MKGRISAAILVVMMATMSMTNVATAEDSGRQMDDVDCSGYSFEDLFEYDNALFMFEILDDWATSDLYANAWVNESRSSVVRDNLDELFDGFPGGNNDWISTDEREAVREIGPKCIADMYTRIGIREGIPHRGGVNWNNATFVEEGIGLDEINLIPEGHPDERDCQGYDPAGLQSDDCREVPVTATNNLEISMFTRDTETHNTRFNQLPNSGLSNFTVSMNATNVTTATMMFTFPYIEGLRMANYTIQDNGIENLDAGTITEIFLPDGSVRVSMSISYDNSDWPMIRNVFFDMTTSPPQTNDYPVWTSNQPPDDTIIPILMDGSEVVAITGETMADWGSDNDAWGLDCQFNEQGWSSRMNADGELLVTPGTSDSGTAVCGLIDPYGATSNQTQTWRFGQPATFSAPAGEYTDSALIESTPTMLVQSLTLSLSATQNGDAGIPADVNLGSSSSSDSVSLAGLSPGGFMLHVTATSPGMLDWTALIDLSLEKKNTPPLITVDFDQFEGTYATWSANLFEFTLSGEARDPDGGLVSLSASMCGETTTSFIQTGERWDVTLPTAKCVNLGVTEYIVTLTAKDSLNAEDSVEIVIPDPFTDEEAPTITETDSDESGLPSMGIFATLIAVLGAAVIIRRD